MKALLDTCVLFPTVMREMLLGVAGQGAFTPLWSDRILEEWSRAAHRLGAAGQAQADGEIALIRAHWPGAIVPPTPGIEARLWLPDPADIHVLAAAVIGSADVIVTMNAKDFPRNILAEEGLVRIDPDQFLHQFWQSDAGRVQSVGEAVLGQARKLSGEDWQMHSLLKKARLPRLAKALSQA